MRKTIKDKRLQHLGIGCMVIVAYCPAITNAEPQNGFGFYGGVVGATENSVTSSGLSIGADAQFAFNNKWSLNPYIMTSMERSAISTTISDELLGLQLRRWFGDWFIGGHFFAHDRLNISNSTTQNSAYGLAFGVLAGVEYANGWGAEFQTDSFESGYYAGVFRNAVRLNLTYRWH